MPWCGLCSEPVRQFAPRPPLHDGEGFVGTPSHLRTASGRYTRWEKTATTFGPVGRIGWTVGIVGYLLVGASSTFFLLWFVQLFISGWLLKEIWKPGWMVTLPPDERPHTEPASTSVGASPTNRSDPPGPQIPEPAAEAPLDVGTIVGRALVLVCVGAALAVFAWGPPEAKGGVSMAAGLLALYALFRWVIS